MRVLTYKGIVEFIPSTKQQEIINELNKNQNLVIRKSRQVGITTILSLHCIDYAIKNENVNILFTSIDKNAKEHIRRNISYNYPELKLKANNHRFIQFENNSYIWFTNKIPMGYSNMIFNLVVVDEYKEDFVFPIEYMNETTIKFLSCHKFCNYPQNIKVINIECKDIPQFNNDDWVNFQKKILGEDIYNRDCVID